MTAPKPAFSPPLFVELSGRGLRHVFELEAIADRAYVVGASRQADCVLDGPGVSAIEFHLEREGDAVWLTPAFRQRGLKVGGTTIHGRTRVAGRLLLSIGSHEFALTLLDDDIGLEATARSSSAPRRLPGNYLDDIPSETQATSLAITPLDPGRALATTTHIAQAFGAPPLPVQHTERMAPAPAAPPSMLLKTQPLPPQPQPAAAASNSTPPSSRTRAPSYPPPFAALNSLLQTQRIEPPRPASGAAAHEAAAPSIKPVPTRSIAAAAPPPSIEASRSASAQPQALLAQQALATQETTNFDVAAVAARVDATPDPVALPPSTVPPAAVAPIGVKTHAEAPASPSRSKSNPPRFPAPFKSLLEQVGLAAKRQPVAVLGGGLVISLTFALAMVGASRVTKSQATATPHGAAITPHVSATAATKLAPVAIAPSSPLPLPSLTVATSPVVPVEKPTPGSRAKHVDSPLAIAVRHTSAGRVAEAAEAYRQLGAAPEGSVYVNLAALLARRSSEACTAQAPNAAQACPEILK